VAARVRQGILDARDAAEAGVAFDLLAIRMSSAPITRLLLVVEDNPGDARLLREMVTGHDALNTEFTHVESMSAAEAHLSERAVDVILLDLGLPDAQGLDAVRRAHTAAPRVPLVVLTAKDDELLAAQSLREGAQDYLVKGQIDTRGLLRVLRYAIERKSTEEARKSSENELLQAQKLESVGRLAGGIAHDFNNMLFAIQGNAELLAQDLGSADPARLAPDELLISVNAISDAAKRAATLTAQLLAFSRRQIVATEVLDINAIVTAISPMVRQLVGTSTQLILKLDPATGHMRADAGQIDQIVVNLVINARDAMPDGGTVTIETGNTSFDDFHAPGHADGAPGPYVFLAITDDGIGMDHETRDHIFEPFFTTKNVGNGTGLGLATAYGVVHQAGGRIFVYSEPGKGSVFKLYFPRVDAPVERRSTVRLAPAVGVGTVLIVEDDPAIRDMTAKLLKRAGYDVLTVANGSEAIARAKDAGPIDVLVTDVVMPAMSGIELAELMMDRYPLIGVVLLSGYIAETLHLERATARGATFVAKPVSSTQLLESVGRAAALRQAASNRAVSATQR
jgi:two-component system cell cycle sensor histidine kinase/response regulator CckA